MKDSKKKIEKIDKDRRFILIGILSMIGVIKGVRVLTKSSDKTKTGTGTLIIFNLIWKILSILRLLLKI